jgi:hypothetical protein
MAWVTVMVRQPIRSADPRARPKVTSRPVRGSGKEPTWLRKMRVLGVGADRQADLLLEGGLGISHACLGGRGEHV